MHFVCVCAVPIPVHNTYTKRLVHVFVRGISIETCAPPIPPIPPFRISSPSDATHIQSSGGSAARLHRNDGHVCACEHTSERTCIAGANWRTIPRPSTACFARNSAHRRTDETRDASLQRRKLEQRTPHTHI